MRLLRGHTGTVLALAYSADGRILASAGLEGRVRLWDLATGAEKAVLTRARSEAVTGLAFVGRQPVVAALRGTQELDQVELWNASTGRLDRTLAAPMGRTYRLTALTVDPLGETLAVGGPDTVLLRWGLGARRPQPFVLDRFDPFTRLAYAPERSVLLAAQGRRVRVYRGPDLACSGELWHSWPVTALAAGRANRVAIAVDASAFLWDYRTRLTLRRWDHGEAVLAVAFAPEGLVFTGTDRGIVRVWHPERDEPVAVFDWQLGRIEDLAVSPDGMTAAVGAASDVLVWDREG
jgi:WD40 repeat protein